jgi:hypothetical protein
MLLIFARLGLTEKEKKEMSEKRRKTVLLLLFVCFLTFDSTTSARPLSDDEKERLYSTTRGWLNVMHMTIDVSFMQKIVMSPEAVRKRRQRWDERVKQLSKKVGPSRIESFGILSPDGSETRLIEERIRICNLSKIRSDTIIFANKEKTETSYEGTIINTGLGKDSPSYHIEHKSKQASIFAGKQWAGREVLRFGKLDDLIAMDASAICNPAYFQKPSKRKKDFLNSGTDTVDGKTTDEVECINLESGKAKYKISLDPNDWNICRKIVRYDNKSGLVSKIVEYKQFAKAKGSGDLFPRLVIRRYFDKEGKEKKVEAINITNVVIGLPISDDVFKFDVPTDYTIIDNREK